MRVSSAAVGALVCAAALASASSCTTFAGVDAPVADGGVEATDGTPGPAAGGLRLPCPPPRAAQQGPPSSWVKRTLYAPPARMYPFAFATDATHVAWVAQPGVGGDDVEPYNGGGEALVLRTSKLGDAPPKVLARNQALATTIALDGDAVYWTTYQGDVASLVRQQRDADCDASCTPAKVVATFPGGIRIVRLIRPAPGVLFALGGGGEVYRIQSEGKPDLVFKTDDFPSLAATATHVFASSRLSASVLRTTVATPRVSDEPFFVVPNVAGASAGVTPIASDCTSLWMFRESDLARRDLAGESFATFTRLAPEIYDLAADATYVYGAAPNAGGVYAVDKASKARTQPYDGNVFALAVDDDGVYFGEHAVGMYAGLVTMLVKP